MFCFLSSKFPLTIFISVNFVFWTKCPVRIKITAGKQKKMNEVLRADTAKLFWAGEEFACSHCKLLVLPMLLRNGALVLFKATLWTSSLFSMSFLQITFSKYISEGVHTFSSSRSGITVAKTSDHFLPATTLKMLLETLSYIFRGDLLK